MNLEVPRIGVAEFALRAGTQPGWSILIVDPEHAAAATSALFEELRDVDEFPSERETPGGPEELARSVQAAGDRTLVLAGLEGFKAEDWQHLDLLRSRLARGGSTILVLSHSAASRFFESAPNLSSWLGSTVWRADLGADILSPVETEQRLTALRGSTGLTDEQVLARGQFPELIGTERDLLRALRKMAREASDENILKNEPHEVFSYIKIAEPPLEARAVRGASAMAIVGGEKNQHRSKDRKHFLRDGGAWFDFAITVARSSGGPLELLGYDFELRFPGPQPPAWIRLDLNLPGHDNDADGLRSHLHPGNNDIQAPAPVLSPLELLDLFLHGFRSARRPRQRGGGDELR